jgi:bifunctional UDP-N-acetylglucosamine pyrophosphorylase/glucosamine-1-phosphate N-acetyltransferase
LVVLKISIVILAAGQGKRMFSDMPKVLHLLADKSLIQHVLNTAQALSPDSLHLVYGHAGAQLRQALADVPVPVQWVEQSPQLGTGHAVAQAMPNLADDSHVLVLYGDVPLISLNTLKNLCQKITHDSIAVLTMQVENPTGYGRIVRDADGNVLKITEEKDADASIKLIKEVNTGILIAPAPALRRWLQALNNNNAQGEYYLTDIIALAAAEGKTIHTAQPQQLEEVLGVNDRMQLAQLERHYQQQQAEKLMQQGVSLRDPARLDVRGEVSVGRDVLIDVDVILEGTVSLGNNVKIGAFTVIRNSQIGDGVEIRSHCILDGVTIGANCIIGPFARLRPETVLAEGAHIGNFVEVKKSFIGTQSKVNHLSYIGDAEVGSKVNIGAGTITCNYDGVNKYKTIIGDGAFIGSDTQLVAPVSVGAGATIGAGSTITQDTPPDALTLSRTRQQTVYSWKLTEKPKK